MLTRWLSLVEQEMLTITQKTKDRATRTPLKIGVELRYSGRVRNFIKCHWHIIISCVVYVGHDYSCEGPGWLNELMQLDYLTTHTSLSPIRRGFASGFVNYKKGALDSQPQVIKFTSCLPMVGGSLQLKLVAMI